MAYIGTIEQDEINFGDEVMEDLILVDPEWNDALDAFVQEWLETGVWIEP